MKWFNEMFPNQSDRFDVLVFVGLFLAGVVATVCVTIIMTVRHLYPNGLPQ